MNNNWIDVSVLIQDSMVHWPTDSPVKIFRTSSIEKGADANVSTLNISAHTGTHIDAPLHFIRNGKDVSEISLNQLTGKIKVFEIMDKNKITLDEIKKFEIDKGDGVFFKTRNSERDWTMQPFNANYIYLETDAATFLRSKEIKCVGIDYLSIGGEENGKEVHTILLGSEILIIEGLNLHTIQAGTYEMICLPLKLKDSDGSPARVIIRKIEN
jgi:arylformamidase